MKRAAATIKGPKGGVWDVFIGLEIHAQIQIRSKLFSRSRATAPSEHDDPNSRYDRTLDIHGVYTALKIPLEIPSLF